MTVKQLLTDNPNIHDGLEFVITDMTKLKIVMSTLDITKVLSKFSKYEVLGFAFKPTKMMIDIR